MTDGKWFAAFLLAGIACGFMLDLLNGTDYSIGLISYIRGELPA